MYVCACAFVFAMSSDVIVCQADRSHVASPSQCGAVAPPAPLRNHLVAGCRARAYVRVVQPEREVAIEEDPSELESQIANLKADSEEYTSDAARLSEEVAARQPVARPATSRSA